MNGKWGRIWWVGSRDNKKVVKPEKYKWKIREVGFLGVVIGLEGIKMEK